MTCSKGLLEGPSQVLRDYQEGPDVYQECLPLYFEQEHQILLYLGALNGNNVSLQTLDQLRQIRQQMFRNQQTNLGNPNSCNI